MKEYSSYARRKPLIEKIPLDTPMGVHVCASTYCNFRCYYCKHTLDENKTDNKVGCLDRALMTMETFERIVDQLKEFPRRIPLLQFAWLGEPLLNKDLPRMVEVAKRADVSDCVSIVTNGSLLNSDLSEALIDAGLDRLRISLQGFTADDYKEVSGYTIDMDQYKKNIQYFYEHKKTTQVYIKIMDVMLKTDEDEKRFHELYDTICDVINVEHLVPLQKELDISDKKDSFDIAFFGNKPVDNMICHYPFINYLISPKGEIFPCASADTAESAEAAEPITMKLSDIFEDTLVNVWNSDKRKELLTRLIKGHKDDNPICRECLYVRYHMAEEDRLDPYVDRLKQIFQIGDKGI